MLCAEADRGGRACSRPVCVAGRGHPCQRDLSSVARAGGGRLCGWWKAYISGGTGLLHLGESVGRLPVQLPELTVSWIHLSRYVNYAQIFKKSAPPAQDTSPAWHSAGCPSGRALQSAGRHTCGGADSPLDMVPRAAL